MFSNEEAEAITRLAPGISTLKATGFDANRQLVASGELGRYRIVHFATHGLINGEHPDLSGLVLSLLDENGKPQNGFLRMGELFNLQLPADLVVLSACRTALGKEIKGEGLIGLTRGFMYAGAERVVASLWQVDDQATSQLMRRFYRGLLKENLRPAAALRAAQIEMSKSSRWSSPYYWSGFIIQGEWR
jgi:CHAT domain-containing protein